MFLLNLLLFLSKNKKKNIFVVSHGYKIPLLWLSQPGLPWNSYCNVFRELGTIVLIVVHEVYTLCISPQVGFLIPVFVPRTQSFCVPAFLVTMSRILNSNDVVYVIYSWHNLACMRIPQTYRKTVETYRKIVEFIYIYIYMLLDM